MTDVEAAESALAAPVPSGPPCASCGNVAVCRVAVMASRGLRNHPQAGRDWLLLTYGVVPDVLCCVCFIPALGGANDAIMRAAQAPGG